MDRKSKRVSHPVQPGLVWYKAQSSAAGALPRCPFATLERCPRFFQSIALLGESGVATALDPAEDQRLLDAWTKSDLWPRTSEHKTAVMGPPDDPKHFHNFCPEVSFERFGLFASHLSRHADEIDSDVAARQLSAEQAPRDDWRWAWSLAVPMHYTDCPLYSPLMASNQSRQIGNADALVDSAAGARGRDFLRSGSMYSLLVSGDPSAWGGKPFQLDRTRFLEFTDDEVVKALGDFKEGSVVRLLRLPCIFAYEDTCDRDPLFGIVTRVIPRLREVRIEYEIIPVTPFLTQKQFRALQSELAIDRTEYFRHHWAVKEVDLGHVLAAENVSLPATSTWRHPANLSTHEFDVGLSFPGEVRPFVREVAESLEALLGVDHCFYDENYTAQLARPNLDLLLQDIYAKRSQLVVVFLCEAYERKSWCAGVEFRAIREIIKARDHDRVMFVRMDDAVVNGVFTVDGAVDGRKHGPSAIARMIKQRVDLLSR